MVSFEEYKNWINKYINNHDTREINFQNDVLKRLLEKLFSQITIASCGIFKLLIKKVLGSIPKHLFEF